MVVSEQRDELIDAANEGQDVVEAYEAIEG